MQPLFPSMTRATPTNEPFLGFCWLSDLLFSGLFVVIDSLKVVGFGEKENDSGEWHCT